MRCGPNAEPGAAAPPSEEAPVYRIVRQRSDSGNLSNLCMIVCDEGWRMIILCTGVYERDAEFLLELLGRKSRGMR